MESPARLIALYLPQFHPIPENDAWWGKGFTEWTNTAKATKLFHGHYQPHVPADLGFYDLRLPETRKCQAELARKYGIQGFCYYHYWFGGKRILEKPLNEVLASAEPDFPFCVCWANQTWSGIWHGSPNRILIEQTYPGPEDHKKHFETLLPVFTDQRYITVDGKPLFLIFQPTEIPNSVHTLAYWREMARASGLEGLYILGMTSSKTWNPLLNGFDARVDYPAFRHKPWISRRHIFRQLKRKYSDWRGLPSFHPYNMIIQHEQDKIEYDFETFPCVIHAWDNTPRSGSNGVVLTGTSPSEFSKLLGLCIKKAIKKPAEHRLIFLKSWNEWAEGNHLEPDLKYGCDYLQAVKDQLDLFKTQI